MGTFISSLKNAASITLIDPIITHSFCIRIMPPTYTDISSTAVSYVAHSKLFPSHFAIFVDYLPILTLYTNISSLLTLMDSSLPKLKSNKRTQMTIPFSVLIQKALDMSFFPLSSPVVVCVHMSALMYKILVYLHLTSLILVFNSSG